jgi:proline iminopeptidase
VDTAGVRVALGDGCRLFVDIESPLLAADGAALAARPTLILIHGGPGFDHASFRAYFPRFRDQLHVIYYDHRGMGRSDGYDDPSRWNLEQWGADLAELIRILGIERPILFGQSFGGFVALEYATKRMGPLAGVVLSSTAARMVSEDALAQFFRKGGEAAGNVAKAYFDEPTVENFETFQTACMPLYNTTTQSNGVAKWTLLRPEVTGHFWRGEMLTFDYREAMSAVDCPIAIFVGTEDPITPVARAEEMAAASNDRAELHVVEDAGHGVFRDKPDLFAGLLLRFVERCSDR